MMKLFYVLSPNHFLCLFRANGTLDPLEGFNLDDHSMYRCVLVAVTLGNQILLVWLYYHDLVHNRERVASDHLMHKMQK